MKKSTLILLIGAFVLCLGLVGGTGYYIGTKTVQPVQQTVATETDAVNVDTEALKAELRKEVEEELYKELYEKAEKEARATVEAELEARIAELQEEADKAEEAKKQEEEAAKQEETKADTGNNKTETKKDNTQKTETQKTETPKTTEQPKQETTTEQPKQQAYINVHDVTASASGGSAAIEAALNGAVDSSSGTVYCNASSITGIGTFPIYWTSTDGATATSYITITE